MKQSKWLLLLPLALIWGSSFILMKKGLLGLNPVQLGALRIVAASLFLIAVGFNSLKKIRSTQWKYIFLSAFVGTFVPVFLFAFAQTQISSSVSGILNSLTPLNTLIFGALFFGLGFQRRQLFGVLIGLTGCLVLILSGFVDNPEQNYYFAILVVIAAACYALNVNFIKKYLSDLNSVSITTGNFVVMLLPALAMLYFSGYFEVIHMAQTQTASLYIVVLAIVGTGIANILFFRLIQISSPIFASSVTYLIPVVAMIWGFLDGEILSPLQLFGALIILGGVYLSSRKA